MNHPIVGELELHYETLYPGSAEDQALVVYTAELGTPSHTGLGLLATIASPQLAENQEESTRPSHRGQG